MKRTLKTKLLILLTALLSLFILAGCSFTETKEDIMEKYNLTAQVTYYSNGGEFENRSSKKTIYYQAGTPALDIGHVKPSSGSADISRPKYTFEGWYFVVEIDEKTGECVLGEKVDFTQLLNEGDNWVVAAMWLPEVVVNVYLVAENNGTVPVDTSKSAIAVSELKDGDLIGAFEYETSGYVEEISPEDYFSFAVKDSAYTFINYYVDKECTTPVEFPIARAKENLNIYARYIEGDWTLIKTGAKLATLIFNDKKVEADEKFWIANDIDCKNYTVSALTSFDGQIKSDGHVIKNLKVKSSELAANSKSAIFGNILENAVIENVTFENLEYECIVKSAPLEIYFVFISLHENATVNNVSISGGMTIRKSADKRVNNMMDDLGELIYTHVLYGGYENDAQYTSANENGFKVTGDPATYITVTTSMY